jgi:hypothetical protein
LILFCGKKVSQTCAALAVKASQKIKRFPYFAGQAIFWLVP